MMPDEAMCGRLVAMVAASDYWFRDPESLEAAREIDRYMSGAFDHFTTGRWRGQFRGAVFIHDVLSASVADMIIRGVR